VDVAPVTTVNPPATGDAKAGSGKGANAGVARRGCEHGGHRGAGNGVSQKHAAATGLRALSELYGPIAGELAEVETGFVRELRSPIESLAPVLRHGTQLGGKRLRPAMLLLAGAAVGQVGRDHVTMGVVIEMVHTATLIHDDVLDDATTRRHVPTINAKWNTHTSILLGDYLFAQSFRLAATLPSTEACQWVGEAARLVCEGELRQVLGRDWLDLDEPTYFEMIRGKTAELCRVATKLGARLSGADDVTVESLSAYGCALGIAFQIADDYLDLWGDDDAIGKTLGTDLAQGKLTLPIIRMLQTSDSVSRRRVESVLSGPAEGRYAGIRDELHSSDAAEYTREVAERFRDQAIEAIVDLPASAAKRSLIAIANFAVDRRF